MENLKKWRQELHQIPELGLNEFQTTNYLINELKKMGYNPKPLLETGCYVFIDYKQKDTLAFRSDIDGLSIPEKTNLSFTSKNQGNMHACGHDGHMSALLGFAQKLKDKKDLPHNILLIFQPAEESPGGAKLVVETGIFERYNTKAIFGMHLMPTIDEGTIACRPGPLMAMCGELDVTIHGKGSHAGLPHHGIDSIIIATQAIQQYQIFISRMISPFDNAIINVGEIHGGTARNSVAETTKFHGTVRCYKKEMFYKIKKHLNKIHNALEQEYGCKIDCSLPEGYPPVLNDKNLYPQFTSLVKEKYVELEEPLMLAEDFSFYQQKLPGIFFFLGTRTNEYQSGLHTPTFNFNEEVLEKAVNLYLAIAMNI